MLAPQNRCASLAPPCDCKSRSTAKRQLFYAPFPFPKERPCRYVSNFISIHRLRPGNDDEDGTGNPDDLLDDEEVFVTKDMLAQVLETRVGGKSKQVDEASAGLSRTFLLL